MPTTRNVPTTTLPEQVTVETEHGTITLSVKETPALKQLIASASAVEKAKLYETIDEYKTQLADSTKEIERLKQTATVQTSTAQPTNTPMVPNSNGTTNATTPATVIPSAAIQTQLKEARMEPAGAPGPITQEQVNDMMLNAFKTHLPDLLKPYLDPLRAATSQLSQEQVSSYREKRLAELGDTVVPELVVGNTKEEIEASIESAKAVRVRYNAATPPPAVPSTPAPAPAATTVPPSNIPPLPQHRTPEDTPVDIKGMSMEDFAKKREQLQSKLNAESQQYPALATSL